jgi:hypothetical protein
MAMREVRCVNPSCGTLNRVPGYSVRRVPRCGKCQTPLPESAAFAVLRELYRFRWMLVAMPFAAWLAWAAWESSTDVGKKAPSPVNTRSAQRPVACTPVEPVTISGISRVYDTSDRPRLTEWTINAGGGADYFVKLFEVSTGLPKVAYFVHGGSVTTTDVPVGFFTIKHASGAIWCGERELFGAGTVIQKGTRNISFDEDHTYTLYLTPQRNGNFPTVLIQRSEF